MRTPMSGPSIHLVVTEPFLTVSNQVHDCYIRTVRDNQVSLIFVIFPKSNHFITGQPPFLFAQACGLTL